MSGRGDWRLLYTGGGGRVDNTGERWLHRLPPEPPGSPPKQTLHSPVSTIMALLSPEGSLLEHVLLCWVNGPVVTLARPSQSLRQLDETLVE